MRPKQVFVATLVVLLTLLGAYLIIELRDIIVLLVIAFTFASAVAPAVTRLNRRLPLGASIGVVYITLILVVAGMLTFIFQPLVSQTGTLINNAPQLLEDAEARIADLQEFVRIPNTPAPDLTRYYSQLAERAPTLVRGVLNVTIGFITGLAGVAVVLVLAFYWLLERRNIEGTWLSLVPSDKRTEARQIIVEIEAKLGGYVRGQLLLAVIVGILSYFGLLILDIEYVLVLALLAGISELIPLVGPFIGAVPAVLVALVESPTKALLVVGLYFIIQQLENHLLVPKVMEHSVGLSALTVLVAVLAGAALLGIVGVVLSVPVASAIQVILNHTLFAPDHVVEAEKAQLREIHEEVADRVPLIGPGS